MERAWRKAEPVPGRGDRGGEEEVRRYQTGFRASQTVK